MRNAPGIHQLSTGRWQARWRDPSGRQRKATHDGAGFPFNRRADAEAFLDALKTDRRRGGYLDPALGKLTLGAFWPQFLVASPHLRPATRELYGRLANLYVLPELGELPLGSITRLDVEAWVADLAAAGCGSGTISATYRLLRRILSAAEAAGRIAKNPARGVKTPKPSHEEMRFLSADELAAVAAAAGERDRPLVLLLGLCGLRIGEAAALELGDVDLLRRSVRITKAASEVCGRVIVGSTKTGASRAVPLPRIVAEAIEARLAAFPAGRHGLVFASPEGGPLRRTNWRRRVWIPALRRAGIAEPLPRPHDLRHTAAALAIAAGAHPKAIQAMLGHSSITVTLDRYGHLFPSLAEQLADALDARMREAVAPQMRPKSAPAVLELNGDRGESAV